MTEIKYYPERFKKYLRKGKWVFCTVVKTEEDFLVHKVTMSLFGVKSKKNYLDKANELFENSINSAVANLNSKSPFVITIRCSEEEVQSNWNNITEEL